jgi:hypothetical protein
VKAGPGQTVLSRNQVFVKRLVLVPQDNDSQLGHDLLLQLPIGKFLSIA